MVLKVNKNILMLTYLVIAYSFVIQEKSTKKYIANDSDGRIAMVDFPNEATRYEMLTSVDRKLDIHIAVKGKTLVFDMGTDGINLLVAEQTHNPSQLFQINLDVNGYYQINQKETFLKFDSFMNGLIGSKYKKGYELGFLLYDDTGVFPYPTDISRGIESPYRKKPKMGNSKVFKSLLNGGVVGSSGYVTYNNMKYSTNLMKDDHDFSTCERPEAADLHAQQHNGAQIRTRISKLSEYNEDRMNEGTHLHVMDDYDREKKGYD
ncbi:hypothetical protein TUBRATIS_26850 [Tubulinosema ratisbonensis]|uniref:Uncharacterized protein n=1 Tax=Tubulinosema ratisbonensis TaxID=291195 RepID=A0A437AIC0_9MICR|nr:hypothetical protein TUBRATIS_26850 [Tubulinosema ratisbonensis]